jgi:hypothetical protein
VINGISRATAETIVLLLTRGEAVVAMAPGA